MIKPEQIPDEVIKAAFNAAMLQKHDSYEDQMIDAITAAINAWPGITHYDEFRVFGQPYSPARIMLPLPQEKNDD